MKMNKEDMAKMGEEDMADGKPMLKVVLKSKPMEEGKEMEESEGEESEGEEYGDKEESDWKAQCDANDLLRAAEIKADPMRMKAALDILGQKKKAIDSMEELMAVRKDKMMKKES
jgi:hypothetical protein